MLSNALYFIVTYVLEARISTTTTDPARLAISATRQTSHWFPVSLRSISFFTEKIDTFEENYRLGSISEHLRAFKSKIDIE